MSIAVPKPPLARPPVAALPEESRHEKPRNPEEPEALIVLSSVPFAIVGSLWTLFLTGFPLSASVWVGLLSVVGLAMQTGVVMVVYVDEAFHRRLRAGAVRSRADIVAGARRGRGAAAPTGSS